MKYIVDGTVQKDQGGAVWAFLELPEETRHRIIKGVLQWAGVTTLPSVGDAPIEWLVGLLTCSDSGEDFIWSALGKMYEAAKRTGRCEGTSDLFARPE